MPIYEYKCDKCGVFEVTRRITENPLKKCPTCKSKVERIISATSFVLKGTGWYVTDYGRSGSKADGKTEGKTEGSTESTTSGSSASGTSSASEGSANGSSAKGSGESAKGTDKSTAKADKSASKSSD
jgi:putative FmdB family regulatory protein